MSQSPSSLCGDMHPPAQLSRRGRIHRFGPFELDEEAQRLTGPEGVVVLRSQALRLLGLLARRAPRVVTSEEIMAFLWGHCERSQSAIPQAIREIRSALGDAARAPRFIATRYGAGYQFVAEVEVVERPASRRRGSGAWTPWALAGAALALLTSAGLSTLGSTSRAVQGPASALHGNATAGEDPRPASAPLPGRAFDATLADVSRPGDGHGAGEVLVLSSRDRGHQRRPAREP